MSRITPQTASRHIQSFNKTFGEAHLYLACHAALPIALTPDLLYLLWQNFQYDINGQQLNIPWIAVADLLLSGLCHEVGHELYEMDLPVRNVLLKNLQNNQNFGKKRINNISNFLLEYIKPQLASTDQDIQDLAQTQRLTALAYLNSEQAARELTIAFAKTNQKDTTELLRITSLVETLAEPLSEYKDLLLYSRGIINCLRGKIEDATNQFLELVGEDAKVAVSGISLPVPEAIKANLSIIETSPNKSLPIIGGGFSALLITILGNFALQYLLQPIFFIPIISNPTITPTPEPTITNSPVPVNINPTITPTPEPTITNLPLTNNIPLTSTPTPTPTPTIYDPGSQDFNFPFLIPNPIIPQTPQSTPNISPLPSKRITRTAEPTITNSPSPNNIIPTPTIAPQPITTNSPSPNNIIPTPTIEPQPIITNSPVLNNPIPTPTVNASPRNTTQPDAQNPILTSASISRLIGNVTIVRNNETPRVARQGDLILPGDVVTTGLRSRAEIVFNDGSLLRVGSSARFRVPSNGLRRIQLQNGNVITSNSLNQNQPTPTPANTGNSYTPSAQQIANIESWRCSPNPDTLQLEFNLSATKSQKDTNPQPEYFQLSQPNRLIIDFPNTGFSNTLNSSFNQENSCENIQQVSFSQMGSTTRVVFNLSNLINTNRVQFQASSSNNYNSRGWILRLSFGRN